MLSSECQMLAPGPFFGSKNLTVNYITKKGHHEKGNTSRAIYVMAAGLSIPARAGDAKENWEKNCAKCHGADGKGQTKMGQKVSVKDLTDAKVQAAFKDEDAFKALKEGLKDSDGKVRMKPVGEPFRRRPQGAGATGARLQNLNSQSKSIRGAVGAVRSLPGAGRGLPLQRRGAGRPKASRSRWWTPIFSTPPPRRRSYADLVAREGGPVGLRLLRLPRKGQAAAAALRHQPQPHRAQGARGHRHGPRHARPQQQLFQLPRRDEPRYCSRPATATN